MKLTQISPSDPVSILALEGLSMTAPILADMEFYSKAGAADSIKKARKAAAKAKITRSINEDNVPAAPTNSYDPVAKKVVSFEAMVDVVLEDRGEDLETELAQQTRLEAIQAGYRFQTLCFTGDVAGDAEDFDGFENLVHDDYTKQVSTNGIIVPVGNSDAVMAAQMVAIEELQKLFAMIPGGASHAYMNEYLKIRILTVAKHLGYYSQSKDELGAEIEKIGSVIIRGAGYAADGTPLLPFGDTVGTSDITSPIYTTRWGEGIDMTALTSKGLVGRYAGQDGNFLKNNVNLDMALALQNDMALYKSEGWRLV